MLPLQKCVSRGDITECSHAKEEVGFKLLKKENSHKKKTWAHGYKNFKEKPIKHNKEENKQETSA